MGCISIEGFTVFLEYGECIDEILDRLGLVGWEVIAERESLLDRLGVREPPPMPLRHQAHQLPARMPILTVGLALELGTTYLTGRHVLPVGLHLAAAAEPVEVMPVEDLVLLAE